jgi:hypothetical protein
MLYIKEPDGTVVIYDKQGILGGHFTTLREAQAWVNDQHREEAAYLEIAARVKQRTRQLISAWAAEAASEFKLSWLDMSINIRWAIEDVLDEMRNE